MTVPAPIAAGSWPVTYTVAIANDDGVCWHCNNSRKTDGDDQCVGCGRCESCIAWGQTVGVGAGAVDNGNDGHAPECAHKDTLLP